MRLQQECSKLSTAKLLCEWSLMMLYWIKPLNSILAQFQLLAHLHSCQSNLSQSLIFWYSITQVKQKMQWKFKKDLEISESLIYLVEFENSLWTIQPFIVLREMRHLMCKCPWQPDSKFLPRSPTSPPTPPLLFIVYMPSTCYMHILFSSVLLRFQFYYPSLWYTSYLPRNGTVGRFLDRGFPYDGSNISIAVLQLSGQKTKWHFIPHYAMRWGVFYQVKMQKCFQWTENSFLMHPCIEPALI